MKHYCGIDLHSNNHVVVVIDDKDKVVYEKRLSNDLLLTLQALSPYQDTLQAVAVESTFNWYWLVDGLQDHGYQLLLVNTAAVKRLPVYFPEKQTINGFLLILTIIQI